MKYQNISAIEAKKYLDEAQAIIIDVREPAEFIAKHIQGASLLPLGKISPQDLPNTDKKIIIYCQKGMRGKSACAKLTDKDESAVLYNLEGGIASWEQAGFNVVKGQSKVLPLDRQVQVTMGLFTFIGSAAAYFFNPLFMLIPAFIGAGLIFAGLSGTCGLALLLAKMPWNQKVA